MPNLIFFFPHEFTFTKSILIIRLESSKKCGSKTPHNNRAVSTLIIT